MAENEIKNNAAENQNPAPVEPPVENPVENNADQAPAKKSWGKKIAKIALTVLIVLVVLVLLLLWQLDRVAATATRTVGSAITGTKVDVESISIRPLAGSVKIKGFTVGNAEGFHNPTAIKVGNLHVAINTSSVLTDKIVVDHLEISDVAIDMEYGISKGSNLDALFDCLTAHRKDRELILHNWHKLEYALKDYSGKALYVFKCACDENRHLTVTLHP